MELISAGGLIVVFGSFVAALVSAAFGLGGGPLMLALMGSFMPMAAVVPIQSALMLGTTSIRTWMFREHIAWSITTPFILGAAIGALLGAKAYLSLPESIVAAGMGALMLVSVWLPKIDWRPAIRHPFVWVGIGQAFISTLVGFGGILQTLLVHSHLNRYQMTATLGSCFAIMNVFKLSGFFILGFAFAPYLNIIAAALVAGFIGTWCGKQVTARLSEAQFRRGFQIVITIGALRLLYRAAFE